MIHTRSYEYGGLSVTTARAYYVRHMTLPTDVEQLDWLQACWARYRPGYNNTSFDDPQVSEAFLIGGWLPWDAEKGERPWARELAAEMSSSDLLAMLEKGMSEGPTDGRLAARVGSRYLSVWQSQPLSRWSHRVSWVVSWDRDNTSYWMREFLQFGLSDDFVRD